MSEVTELDRRIGQLLWSARRRAGLTQEALAGALHVARSTISLWEAGSRRINAIDLLRVLEVAGVPHFVVLDHAEDAIRYWAGDAMTEGTQP